LSFSKVPIFLCHSVLWEVKGRLRATVPQDGRIAVKTRMLELLVWSAARYLKPVLIWRSFVS